MSRERRDVFLMRVVDGLTPAEVAEKRQITVDAVLKSLKRAGHQLRRHLLDFLG
jgi:DNA-directed RNA polymerase specialized sigma24 family protein